MPHLVILYTANLDCQVDMRGLCHDLAATMRAARDDAGQPVFPTGGIRVLAYPAPLYAVADGGDAGRAAGGDGDYGFVYLNLRMGRGRSDATKKRAGDDLMTRVKAHFDPLISEKHLGVTLQIDEGPEVFDAKHSSLHPLFNRPNP